jgi:hypothetical protein
LWRLRRSPHSQLRELWRRVHPKHIILDQNLGKMRPSSAAFTNSSQPPSPMSVLRAKLIARSRRDEYAILRKYPGEALVAFTAGFARRLGQGIEPAPAIDEPAHAHVCGAKPKRTVQRVFAKKSVWVVRPDVNKVVSIPENIRPNRVRFMSRRLMRGMERFWQRFAE